MKTSLKAFFDKVVATYNANGLFHSTVVGLEVAVSSYITSYAGGFPTSKAALVSFFLGLAGVMWGVIKGGLRQYAQRQALQKVQGK